ncbi:Protein CBR-GEX-3 [Caenorhabditis briggsae]|uniref:Protein CBR-GEX-3 n=1 Tax=Caenorhabditis briggsae TaxID=6238 RepID=A8WUS8_CAEBR|nr:Protein CBR-GEX-3 [Caenorhabditis briggsae]CAP24240.1 Protein CBR-GEX-3 [Caenorhabditis briggsae]
MSYKIEASQLKIAEKLVVLNNRAVGMMTRMYNIKKSSGDSKVKPYFLSDKKMEGAIKHIVRKFPVVDCRSNTSTFEHVQAMSAEVTKSLSLYYYTFADLLDLKDHIMQVLTTMETCQCQLDVTLNYDLTTGYLNLVVNLITMMILLSRIEDRKAVLGLFNAGYDLQHGQSEASFPRLGQMILDYENPLKKLSEDLGPLNRLIFSALSSVGPSYLRRNKTAEYWRTSNIFSLTAAPGQILYAAQTETMACEYLSIDIIDRWIIFCATICHSSLLNDANILSMWQAAVQTNFCIRLFRDETFLTHQEIQTYFESTKDKSKRLQDLKEAIHMSSSSIGVHADRRRFLRSSLRELSLLLRDQPGLLGPKILYVWMALGAGRDEVIWLLRHQVEMPLIAKKGNKTIDELIDRQIPELLFYMLELRDLVVKYSAIIQRYYLQYVSSYDSIVVTEEINHASGLSTDEAILLTDFANSISNINSDTDLRALRLDWFRFQAWVSVSRNNFQLLKHRKLANFMNTSVFHLKMIDLQDEMLRETSDLSIYCFYPKLAERHWINCLQLPAQARYVLSFARLAGHFTSALHDMCPEEKTFITEKALAQCNSVIEETCRQVSFVLEKVAEHEFGLAYQMTPSAVSVRVIAQVLQQKGGKAAAAAAAAAKDYFVAGEESHRVDRQALTMPDKLQTTLLELCAALGVHRQIHVADHTFAPRTYLSQSLESTFVDLLHRMLWEGQENASNPRRPSEMLLALQAYMTVFQNLDTAISVDISNTMQAILLQQTQSVDSRNKDTITAFYTKWYLEVLLRRASAGHMIWSEHQRSMLAYGQEILPVMPDQYSDPQELRALVQIIGPYGIKFMSERLIWHVASQIMEMSKIVGSYKEALQVARSNFDNAEKMKEVLNILSAEPKDKKGTNTPCAADAILQRTIIIGQICAFRDALHDALRDVVDSKLPFLQSSFNMFYQNLDYVAKVKMGEMSAALGVKGPVDMSLVNAVRAQNQNAHPQEHYINSCLLMVAIAVSIPRIGMVDQSTYKPSIQAALNNSHCVPIAINTIGSALFHLHDQNDIPMRMKEFLALASSGILRTIHERDNGRTAPDDALRSHNTLYIILEQMVRKNHWISMNVLEACFPYNLVRTAYQQCYEAEPQ